MQTLKMSWLFNIQIQLHKESPRLTFYLIKVPLIKNCRHQRQRLRQDSGKLFPDIKCNSDLLRS